MIGSRFSTNHFQQDSRSRSRHQLHDGSAGGAAACAKGKRGSWLRLIFYGSKAGWSDAQGIAADVVGVQHAILVQRIFRRGLS